MKHYNFYISIIIILNFSCVKNTEKDNVSFEASFTGARLDSTRYYVENDKYIAYINPAFEPVNKSTYYAFAVTSEKEKEIKLELNYGNYKHRYIPKLSFDKKTWKKIEASKIRIDTVYGTATLKLNVSPKKIYVAAQEIETSKDTYNWVDSLLITHSFLKREIAGKTVMQNNNYVVTTNDSLNKAIVLIARQHPPETPGGSIGFKAFYGELLADNKTSNNFRNQYNIIAFPLLNPDGADKGYWRHNANGKDLNRDWIDFSQPETKIVKSYFEDLTSKAINIKFALDFHTSYSGPYLLILDSLNETKTRGVIPKWIKGIESNSQFKVESRRRSQELPYCYNYFFNQLGSEAVTYEDGDEINRDTIRERAKVYARELMKTILSNKANEIEQ